MSPIKTALVVIAIIGAGVVWCTQYVVPKHNTLMAASTCMFDQKLSMDNSAESKAAWEGCLSSAVKQHGSSLLIAVGF